MASESECASADCWEPLKLSKASQALFAKCFAQQQGVRLWLQAQISRWSYIVMAAVFALSTPLGVAIGLGVQSTYSEKSPTALGVQGVFDSVAAGAHLLQPMSGCCLESCTTAPVSL